MAFVIEVTLDGDTMFVCQVEANADADALVVITAAVVFQGANLEIYDITATADGDQSENLPHGLPVTPLMVTITPLLQAPAEASEWAVTRIVADDIELTKSTAVGSGDANPQVRLIVAVPHSLFL